MPQSGPSERDAGRHARTAGLLVLSSVISTQAGSALATRLFTVVNPAGATALRLLGGTLVLAAVAGPRALRAIPRSALPSLAAFGLASTAMNLSFYEAISRIPLGTAVTVEFLGPIGLAALTSRRRRHLGLALLALVGVVLVSGTPDGRTQVAGILFAAGAGAMWALYLLFGRRVGRTQTGLAGLAVALAMGSAVTAPLLVVAHPAARDVPLALALGLAVGALSNALCYGLEVAALRRASITTVGVLLSIEPAVAAIVGFVALHQGVTHPQLLGIALVVVAGAGVVRWAEPA